MTLDELLMRPMLPDDIPAVRALEVDACAHVTHAWSEDNYRSSLTSGYWMQVACQPDGAVVGVCVAMLGVDELHLLNIAVARPWQSRGLARHLLALLITLCREHHLQSIWLEVRPTNARARALYARQGYLDVGLRKQYYPAADGREDALVMKLEVTP